MPTFLNQPLLWGLGIVAAPVIIHMINMLRHKRVKWAAMEFLLASQRKHSTWIRLKELLLLLLRMAAVAAVVMIVARPRLDGSVGKRLGDVTTHHIVLLDDSFSMSDRFAERNVFDEAKAAVERIASTALEESSAQTFTLLRASRASAAGPKPDILEELVNSDFVFKDRPDRKLNRVLEPLAPSDSAVGPEACLKALSSLLKSKESEERVIYIVSDFRAKDWRDISDLRTLLGAQEKKSAQIYFIRCADADRPNLAVASLQPQSGTVAAGIHFYMQVEVTNFGTTTAEKTAVEIRSDGASGGVVFLEAIPPGKTVRGTFPVYFSDPGEHLVSVSLEADAVDADNRRYAALHLPAEMPVLLIDGEAESPDAAAIAWALAPPGPVRSGIAPRRQAPAYLNDAEKNPLGGFRSIYLVNVPKLDAAAVRNLEAYVRAGGGLAFVVGDRASAQFYNESLYRDGEGLFPAPLDSEKPLFRDREAKASDVAASTHPIFKHFADEQNSRLYQWTVDKYFGVRDDWTPEVAAKSLASVIVKLRNGAPLAVEKPFGKGRVVALLTKPSRPWSDWMYDNPSFIVAMLELQSYISSREHAGDESLVGTPIAWTLDPKSYDPEVRFLAPGASESTAVVVQAAIAPQGLKVEFADTSTAGFYRTELTKTDRTSELRHSARNVDSDEGELRRIDDDTLREQLAGIKVNFRRADRIQLSESENSSSNMSTAILYALAILLIGEQALAYSAAYHPSTASIVRKGAVA
ncbi:MAG: BatA domain-containing protein [Planctomycetia bacterium]|nr:BatA domain-containing protein [Planctomycetia bacterium]